MATSRYKTLGETLPIVGFAWGVNLMTRLIRSAPLGRGVRLAFFGIVALALINSGPHSSDEAPLRAQGPIEEEVQLTCAYFPALPRRSGVSSQSQAMPVGKDESARPAAVPPWLRDVRERCAQYIRPKPTVDPLASPDSQCDGFP